MVALFVGKWCAVKDEQKLSEVNLLKDNRGTKIHQSKLCPTTIKCSKSVREVDRMQLIYRRSYVNGKEIQNKKGRKDSSRYHRLI